MKAEHPTPWRVYDAKLRPTPGSPRIVEVRDANGHTVLSWNGFDAYDHSHATKLRRVAKRIVAAVNKAAS